MDIFNGRGGEYKPQFGAGSEVSAVGVGRGDGNGVLSDVYHRGSVLVAAGRFGSNSSLGSCFS